MTLSVSNSFNNNIQQKTAEELDRVLNAVLFSNHEIICGLNEIKTVSGWYSEAKKDPDKIPTIVVNEAIKRLVEHVVPTFSRFLIDKINVEIETRKGQSKIKILEIKFAVKPYVEYIKKIDDTDVNKVKITFSIAITGKLEDITIRADSHGKQVFIERASAALTISILTGTVSNLYLSINPVSEPIILYHDESLKIEKISFHL
jgi:hypothetical protein